jgi:uncharacterized lipoprotein YddW (UPF0748 family)
MSRPLALAFAVVAQAACTAQPPAPPPIAREFRGAWVATVDNIDFPSRPGLPAAALRTELDAIVARAVELKLNALVFQVRPAADAFYASPLEPWSEWLTGAQGRAPEGGFDPLAYAIERSHAAGLQLHAWFNPFRAWHPAGKSEAHESHVTRKAPQLVVQYGRYRWMDPGVPLAVQWSLATIQDVVRRYDVDGVHLDDYFYPYPEGKQAFPDDASYAKYRAGGGRLSRSDWRRANIDDYVQRLRAIVHADKPYVAVGISPFGIARPGVPAGIEAGIDQYEQLAADVPKWLRQGWVDYLVPQLYWPIDQKPQAFGTLLAWWHTQNPRQRHLWPGINPGRALARAKNWRPDELAEQIALIRAADRTPGHVHFSFKALRPDAPHVAGALRDRVYAELALGPALPWLGSTAPRAPACRWQAGSSRVEWTAAAEDRFVAVQTFAAGAWQTHAIVGAAVGRTDLPPGTQAVAVTAVSRTGIASPPAIVRR